MFKPKVIFKLATFEQNMDIIAMFIHSELEEEVKVETAYFKSVFPLIETVDYTGLNIKQISNLLQLMLYDSWKKEMNPYLEVVESFQTNWNLINDEVMVALEERLNIKWPESTDVEAFIGIMSSCPRNIINKRFYVNADANINRMREVVIHEICHFLYFEKWQEIYNNYDEEHYDYPNLIWYLSEAMIDPLLNNSAFTKYTNSEIKSYDTFYNKKINGDSIIESLREIVNNNGVEEAIKKSYQMFSENEDLIKGKSK